MMNTNILEASRINNIKRLVYTSSIGAYDKKNILTEGKDTKEPLDLAPGWAKRMAEYQIHNYKIEYPNNNFFSCRLSNVFGPGDNFDIKTSMVIPSLIFKAINSKGKRIKLLGTGNEIRDFIYSKDVTLALIQVLMKGFKGLPYLNIGSGKGITIKKLAESIANHIPFKFYFESNDKIVGYNKEFLALESI